jgi:signal recognition particle subunit SEC65
LGTPNFDSAAARRYGPRFRMLADPTHISLFSEDSIRRLVRDIGFKIENVEYPYFETPWFSKKELLRILDKDSISPPFYGSILTLFACKPN